MTDTAESTATDFFDPSIRTPEMEMAERGAWDASEMSLALYTVKRSRALGGGEPFPFTAIPVFPSRVFRHGNIFINNQMGITAPKDLEG